MEEENYTVVHNGGITQHSGRWQNEELEESALPCCRRQSNVRARVCAGRGMRATMA